MERLKGKKVAILVADGFEQVELTEPRKALDRAGATTRIVSPARGRVRGWDHKDWGDELKVDEPLDVARPENYDALLLPGGVMSPDKLRQDVKALAFVRSFFDSGKPVAAICHGPWMLIDAGVAGGRRMTSWPSLKSDLQNAGVEWTDREVVVDNGLVTSRKPGDIPVFVATMLQEFAENRGEERRAG